MVWWWGCGKLLEPGTGAQVLATHPELNGRVTLVDTGGISNHATRVAGTIAATEIDPAARGMANQAVIRSRDSANDVVELAADANLIDISNHSYATVQGWTRTVDWGLGAVDTWIADRSANPIEDPRFGKYVQTTHDIDDTLFDNPQLLSVWAAGNDRGETIPLHLQPMVARLALIYFRQCKSQRTMSSLDRFWMLPQIQSPLRLLVLFPILAHRTMVA